MRWIGGVRNFDGKREVGIFEADRSFQLDVAGPTVDGDKLRAI
jgi:hypothetical protein